ncbi:MAG TPA: phenylalanine--tRNA ligase subunit beta [Acidimicrobiales bacterium]|nr:phenylalanine--tRNA ligase subunit beta [Acidimicrobiales bacterium]
MRAPLSWIREFAPVEGDAPELAATLSSLGLVVEGVQLVGESLDQVVVARVLATGAHPRADRVQLVDVDPGDGSSIRVVCGAFNFGTGDLVPLARPGTRLPGGLEIGRRKVRGEWSDGMLCSAAELALGDDHSGILVLPPGAEPGVPLADALGVGPDVVFDIDVTPNRPDALSVAGVARDLAARLGVPFAVPEPPPLPHGEPARANVTVEAADLCPRFSATRLEGVTVGPSPRWMASRLTLAGMRPINNVVDISNYVMLELGQPNHPYDLERLGGEGLLVRRGEPGEVVVTLDGVERPVGPDDCLICDADGAPVGIGGIMGGANSEIAPTTATVLLEAAWFAPLAVARTSARLALRTEASVRFERGVDPEITGPAVARFYQLAGAMGAGRPAGATVDVRGSLPDRPRVLVRTDRVNAVLGTTLEADEVSGYLEPIGFECEAAPAGGRRFTVTIPSWRPDCEREIDVIEEVGRHHGYDRITRTVPLTTAVGGGLTPYQRDRRRVRSLLAGLGLNEAWANSFLTPEDLTRAGLSPDAVEVENPLAQEESALRTSLLPGLLEALVTNASHRNPDVALFEIGHIFLPPPPGEERPSEPEHLAVVLAGRSAPDATRLWMAVADALGLEGLRLTASAVAGLHPTRSARIHLGDDGPLGALGEVDPDVLAAHDLEAPVAWLEVDLEAVLGLPRRPAVYRPVSRFPSADEDFAFVVDEEVAAAAVLDVLRNAAGEVVEDAWLFDVYRGPQLGEGRRSLAFRVRFSALDHTLAEDELATLRTRCIEAVESSLPAQLRA